MSARTRERISGVILIDKELDVSSNLAVQILRRVMNAAKAGHTGTLDPKATGLLPMALGEATKYAGGFIDADKTYEAEIVLGVRTSTDDTEGEVLEVRPVAFALEELAPVLEAFRGEIDQVPPMHSAIKRSGEKLYEIARRGGSVALAPRRVRIDELEILAWEPPRLALRVSCSKGTYIRALARDIGEKLGCGAHLSALRRTRVGRFRIEDAITLKGLEALGMPERRARLMPCDAFLEGMPRLDFPARDASRLLNGQRMNVRGTPEGTYRLYAGEAFLGTGRVSAAGTLSPAKMVSAPEGATMND